MKPSRDELLKLVEAYFHGHLQRARGASAHTIRAYGHALRLFFLFLAKRVRRSVALLRLDDIRVEAVLAFLDHLESSRHNSAVTRNSRLAAIHGFVEHLLGNDISRSGQYQRILDIRPKRARGRIVEYLEAEHVRAIIAQPDRRTSSGARYYALLLLLFNTGARVAEVLALGTHALRTPRQIRVCGKGKKERVCPLWPETAAALRVLIRENDLGDGPLFRNARGEALTRDGVAYILERHTAAAALKLAELRRRRITPHVLRHSCAVALLQAGVDPTVIRDYLGHATVATTNRYITSNIAMKRDALVTFWRRAGLVPGPTGRARWRPKPGLIDFLTSL